MSIAETEKTIAKVLNDVFTAQDKKQRDKAFSEIDIEAEKAFKQIRTLVGECKKLFVDRDEAVDVMAAGLMSGISVVLLGAPGTAKSAIARAFAQACGIGVGDARYFEYLMTNHTMPEELFGGPDLRALKEGIFRRNIERKLPEAEFVFLDEVFRGGGHILNTLLTILNEKRFDSGSGGGTKHVPLLGVIGASNNPPESGELDAFYDRFPIRLWVDSIFAPSESQSGRTEDAQRGRQLTQASVAGEMKRLIQGWGDSKVASGTSVCAKTDDFRWARAHILVHSRCDGARVSKRDQEFHRLFSLCRDRAGLSDRTYAQLILFGCALDLLRGADPHKAVADGSRGHVDVFKYVSRSKTDVPWLEDRIRQHTVGSGYTGNV